VPLDSVISCWDVDSIYKIPSMLHKQGLDEIVCFQARHRGKNQPIFGVGPAG